MEMFDINELITFTDNNHRSGKIGKIAPKRIVKEDVDRRRDYLVRTLSKGMAKYIGVYKDNIKSICKPLIEIKNGLAVTMTDSALSSKVERILETENRNSYYRSLAEDFTNMVLENSLEVHNALTLREVSLEGLKASPKVFRDEKFLEGSDDLRLINSFKRAINDFLIQIGDKTLILSIAANGHKDDYDSLLQKINDSYFFTNVLGVSFVMLDVPIDENGIIEYEKYLSMLLDTLTNFFNIEINENKEELMDIAKKNTFLAYTYKLRKSLDITMEQSLSYMA